MRTKQAIWFHFIFYHSSRGVAGLGAATCAVQLGNGTCLHRVASEPRRHPMSLAAVSPGAVLSPHWWSLCGLGRRWLERLVSLEKVKGQCDSSLRGGGWGRALGWACCSDWMSAAQWQLLSALFMAGSQQRSLFSSCMLVLRTLSEQQGASLSKNLCGAVAELFGCQWQNACSWWCCQQSSATSRFCWGGKYTLSWCFQVPRRQAALEFRE